MINENEHEATKEWSMSVCLSMSNMKFMCEIKIILR